MLSLTSTSTSSHRDSRSHSSVSDSPSRGSRGGRVVASRVSADPLSKHTTRLLSHALTSARAGKQASGVGHQLCAVIPLQLREEVRDQTLHSHLQKEKRANTTAAGSWHAALHPWCTTQAPRKAAPDRGVRPAASFSCKGRVGSAAGKRRVRAPPGHRETGTTASVENGRTLASGTGVMRWRRQRPEGPGSAPGSLHWGWGGGGRRGVTETSQCRPLAPACEHCMQTKASRSTVPGTHTTAQSHSPRLVRQRAYAHTSSTHTCGCPAAASEPR
jgi:hypothetical protein